MASSILDHGPRSILKQPFKWDSHARIFYPTPQVDEKLIEKYSKQRNHKTTHPLIGDTDGTLEPVPPTEESTTDPTSLGQPEDKGVRVRITCNSIVFCLIFNDLKLMPYKLVHIVQILLIETI